MRKSGFFPKLALQNIGKNRRFYFPYILTGIVSVAMFYIMCFLTTDDGISSMPGSGEVRAIMVLGCIVIGLFAAVFLFYTNSFLMKRRKKELGLYSILGMEKRHISCMMSFENLYVALICIVCGLFLGILFSKIMLLLLVKLLRFQVSFGFSVSVLGLIITAIVFVIIFFLTFLSNLFRVGISKPIELLSGGSVGEKEPKTKWLLTIIGVLALGSGYAIAIIVKSPLEALALFFVAVVLVMIGTYCLFTAGSIAVLKLLRKNKCYYYQTKHFTAVSGMIYRMKQNAVGLANICILATMVLVTVSTTVCLYLGTEDSLNAMYPHDISISFGSDDPREQAEKLLADFGSDIEASGLTVKSLKCRSDLSFAAARDGSSFNPSDRNYVNDSDGSWLTFVTAADQQELTGKTFDLRPGEAYLYGPDSAKDFTAITVGGVEFKVVGWLTDDEAENNVGNVIDIVDFYYIVVPDYQTLQTIYNIQLAEYQDAASDIKWNFELDVDGSADEKLALYQSMLESLQSVSDETSGSHSYSSDSRQSMSESLYAAYGGFLFIGLFLGTMFLMGAVLIIYYKQISEGYDDRERFVIMQQVGMSEQEVRSTISSQILTVFFLPLVTAVIHICAAFKMITRLLSLFNLSDVHLFAMCTGGTVLVFAIIYAIIYALTAKVYYQIVRA